MFTKINNNCIICDLIIKAWKQRPSLAFAVTLLTSELYYLFFLFPKYPSLDSSPEISPDFAKFNDLGDDGENVRPPQTGDPAENPIKLPKRRRFADGVSLLLFLSGHRTL